MKPCTWSAGPKAALRFLRARSSTGPRSSSSRARQANTLNYDVRVLGREGVLSMNAVASMGQLAADPLRHAAADRGGRVQRGLSLRGIQLEDRQAGRVRPGRADRRWRRREARPVRQAGRTAAGVQEADHRRASWRSAASSPGCSARRRTPPPDETVRDSAFTSSPAGTSCACRRRERARGGAGRRHPAAAQLSRRTLRLLQGASAVRSRSPIPTTSCRRASWPARPRAARCCCARRGRAATCDSGAPGAGVHSTAAVGIEVERIGTPVDSAGCG